MTSPTKIDAIYEVESPEGILLTFHPASPIVRSLAFMTDFCCQLVIGYLFAMTVSFILSGIDDGYLAIGILLIGLFFLMWGYYVFFEVFNQGQTLGKRLFNLRVIHDDGTPIGWSASLLRNLLRVVDILPSMSYTVGIFCGMCHPHFKRLGDIAAGTIVIHDLRYAPPKRVTTTDNEETIPVETSPIALTPDEQRALISFLLRKEQFSHDRRLELADLLKAVFPATARQSTQAQHRSTLDRLYGIASGLLGNDLREHDRHEPPKNSADTPEARR